MNTRLATTLALTLLLTAITTTATAQDASPVEPPPELTLERSNSVNVSPLGLLAGAYALNYEYLHAGYHGLLVEATLDQSSNDDGSSLSYGGALGYRLHWSGEQDSGFVGLTASFQQGSGDATVSSTVNGETTKTNFEVNHTFFGVTANLGKRWAWDFGLNVTFRLGAGYGSYSFDTPSDDPGAQLAVDLVEGLLTLLPVALEGELSMGYNF